MIDESPGPGVDRLGQAVVDPTKNVLDLVAAESKFQNAMREIEARHIRELMDRDEKHAKELRDAESKRLDAIREVDVANVQRAAQDATDRALVLDSKQQSTADAFRISLAAELDPLKKDIAELRQSQFEIAGGTIVSKDTKLSRATTNALIATGIGIVMTFIIGAAAIVIALVTSKP